MSANDYPVNRLFMKTRRGADDKPLAHKNPPTVNNNICPCCKWSVWAIPLGERIVYEDDEVTCPGVSKE